MNKPIVLSVWCQVTLNSGVIAIVNHYATAFTTTVVRGRLIHFIADGDNSSVSGGSFRTVTGLDDWRAGSLFERF